MPFTSQQLIRGADYTLQTYRRTDPVDQINTERSTLAWFVANRQESMFGNGVFGNPVYVDNNSNFQRYFGADQVTYNERDPARQALFNYYNNHEGFFIDEDRLRANNIVISEDALEAPTRLEKDQLVNLLAQNYRAVKEGMQNGMAFDLLLDGSQSSKACPGLDHIVSTTPTTGIVGDLNRTNTWWRNNINLGVAQGALLQEMEETWRACMTYGKKRPTKIICGAAFLDDYRAACKTDIGREIVSGGLQKGGVNMDGAINSLSFKGVELTWDPMFELLDAQVGVLTHPWTKRCYFLNEKSITLRPLRGEWMKQRKPERLPDRYVHYFGLTASYGLTTDQLNSLAVISID